MYGSSVQLICLARCSESASLDAAGPFVPHSATFDAVGSVVSINVYFIMSVLLQVVPSGGNQQCRQPPTNHSTTGSSPASQAAELLPTAVTTRPTAIIPRSAAVTTRSAAVTPRPAATKSAESSSCPDCFPARLRIRGGLPGVQLRGLFLSLGAI